MFSLQLLIMQNVRSKSMTAVPVPGGALPVAAGAWRPASDPRRAAAQQPPRLRVVPGRVALFLVVLCAAALMLVPRLVAVASVSGEPRVHVVQSGETLWGVATQNTAGGDPRDYVDRLRDVNRLSTPQIFPGQRLVLP